MTLTLLDLRRTSSTILTDGGYLGEYDWGTGENTEAIAVLPHKEYGYDFPPNEVKVNKIELAIIQPEIKNQSLLAKDILQKVVYKMYLKQWEERDNNGMLISPNVLRPATQALYEGLLAADFEVTTPSYPGKSERLGIIESSYLTAYCHQLCIIKEQFPTP